MASVTLEHVDKIYDNHVQAVFDFNLEVKDKEFIVFVGPSGCGKSTTLRMIAGLETVSAGDVYIDGNPVTEVEPSERGVAMVFQSYALYPHMTVFNNMAFSLKMMKKSMPVLDEQGNPILEIDKQAISSCKKAISEAEKELRYKTPREEFLKKQIEQDKARIATLESKPSKPKVKKVAYSKEEIKERVEGAAKILGLTELLDRKPKQLSGGQRQRVALGRAIVRNAKIFLMDEPLSNLDAKLRVSMRSELVKLHKEVGSTTIYVTHDQTEAMTMADRIVVMKGGRIQQVDAPQEIFDHPANLFVATFIGSPSMNIVRLPYQGGVLSKEDWKLDLGEAFDSKVRAFFASEEEKAKEEKKQAEGFAEVYAQGGRKNAKAYAQRQKQIEEAEKKLSFYYASSNGGVSSLLLGIRPEEISLSGGEGYSGPAKTKITQMELLGDSYICYGDWGETELCFRLSADLPYQKGDLIDLYFPLDKIHLFDPASTLALDYPA